MGIWAGIKYALNSTLGTDKFEPLDKILMGEEEYYCNESGDSVTICSNKNFSSTALAGSFTAEMNGSVLIMFKSDTDQVRDRELWVTTEKLSSASTVETYEDYYLYKLTSDSGKKTEYIPLVVHKGKTYYFYCYSQDYPYKISVSLLYSKKRKLETINDLKILHVFGYKMAGSNYNCNVYASFFAPETGVYKFSENSLKTYNKNDTNGPCGYGIYRNIVHQKVRPEFLNASNSENNIPSPFETLFPYGFDSTGYDADNMGASYFYAKKGEPITILRMYFGNYDYSSFPEITVTFLH